VRRALPATRSLHRKLPLKGTGKFSYHDTIVYGENFQVGEAPSAVSLDMLTGQYQYMEGSCKAGSGGGVSEGHTEYPVRNTTLI
jgi:hypothetical protein